MNPNIVNIKEILRLPPVTGGTQKTASLSTAASDYSNLTDSQFLFGSQFWPEQSQSLSQEICLPGSSSQQNTEVNERSISTSYQTKPYLFGGDSQDKSKGLTLCSSKNKGILERFEEDKKKAKEKNESDMLMNHVYQLGGSMENVKLTLTTIDGSIESAKRVILEQLECLAVAVQNQGANVRDSVVPKLELLLNNLATHAKMLKDLEDRETKMGVEMSAIQSSIENLHQDLEIIKSKQNNDQCVMGDLMSLLRALVSSQRFIIQKTDGAVQTSPHMFDKFYLVKEETRYVEDMQLCGDSRSVAVGEKKKPEKNIMLPSNVAVHTGHCLTIMPAARENKKPQQKSYNTRSTGTQGLGNGVVCIQQQKTLGSTFHSPAKFAKENNAQKGGNRSKRLGENGNHWSGHNYRKACKNGQAPRRRSRQTPLETGKTWTWPHGESTSICQNVDKVDVQLESSNNIQSCTENQVPTWLSHKIQTSQTMKTKPQTNLWQLFNISDDSD